MSGGVFGDDVGSLVFDIGSNSFRVGFAGEDIPKADFPTAVGVVEGEGGEQSEKKYFFDTVNINVPRKNMEMVSCLKEGMVEDWDLFEKQLDCIYTSYIRSQSEYHPVLMSEPAWNTRQKRERITELMFEKYNLPAFFLAKNAVLSVYANGRTSGLVLDSGATLTSAVPVYDGYVIQQGIIKSPLAGEFVLMESCRMLEEMEVEVVPPYLVAEKEPVLEEEPAEWKRKEGVPEVTKSFKSFSKKAVLRDFASQTLQVTDQPFDESMVENLLSHNFEFPNGYNHLFGPERFTIPEKLFDPSTIKDMNGGNSMLSMSHVVATSIGFCDIDIKPSLYNNVIVVGGNTLINGFIERLTRDLSAKSPPSMKLKVISSPIASERKFSSWIGGSILGSMGSFQHMWISRQEYEEGGKACVEKKCP